MPADRPSDLETFQLSDAALGLLAFEFAERAQTATSLAEVEQDLALRLASLGIQNFTHSQAVDNRGKPSAALVAGRSNTAWRKHYHEHAMAGWDPLLQLGLASPEPTTWNRYLNEHRVSKKQRGMFERAKDFNIQDGYFLPIHQLDGSVACVTLVSERALPANHRAGAALHMLALYYSFAVRRFKAPAPPAPPSRPALTSRQRECLQWVRAGKTDWEISQIMGISEHTVIEHLEQARRRLKVKTRTQAVIEAISLGLISI